MHNKKILLKVVPNGHEQKKNVRWVLSFFRRSRYPSRHLERRWRWRFFFLIAMALARLFIIIWWDAGLVTSVLTDSSRATLWWRRWWWWWCSPNSSSPLAATIDRTQQSISVFLLCCVLLRLLCVCCFSLFSLPSRLPSLLGLLLSAPNV